MVKAHIYLEGGGDYKYGKIRCREGFNKLLEKCGFTGRMPKLTASGSRNSAYDDFKTAHAGASGTDYVALLVDSEDPVTDIGKPWAHLFNRDGWLQPPGATDDQALLMTTCMETWITADHGALASHFGQCLQASALPPPQGLENRGRDDVQTRLENATRDCPGMYAKGKKSFELLGKLDPKAIEPKLPSFGRACKILNAKL